MLMQKWGQYVLKQNLSEQRKQELLEMADHVYGCLKTQ